MEARIFWLHHYAHRDMLDVMTAFYEDVRWIGLRNTGKLNLAIIGMWQGYWR